jgi:outer membrane autotransporter protein
VTGTATIQSGATVNVIPTFGVYTIGKQYTILTATGGVTGQYSALTNSSPFVTFQLASDADDIFLDVTAAGVPFAQIAQTRNQIATSGALQSLGAGNAIFNALLFLNTPAALHAFDLLSGEMHASIVSTLLDDSGFVREAIIGRLRQNMGGVASLLAPNLATEDLASTSTAGSDLAYARKPAPARDPIGSALSKQHPSTPNDRVVTAWGQIFGDWGQIASDGNAARLAHSTGGIISGIDTTLAGQRGEFWRFGFAGGYQESWADVADRNSSGNVSAYHFAAYGGMQNGPLALRGGAAYDWQNIGTARNIGFTGFSDTANSSYDAQTAQAFGEIGYGLTYRTVAAEPFADLAVVHIHTDAFTEAGGAAALTGVSGNYDTTYSTLGIRAASPLSFLPAATGVTVKGSVGWQHAFGTITPTSTLAFVSTPGPFVVAGVPVARDAAALELGVDARFSQGTVISVEYTGQLASSLQDSGVTARFTQRF